MLVVSAECAPTHVQREAARATPGRLPPGDHHRVTVVLGFSLVFLRVWSFELPGEWDVVSITSAILTGLATLALCVTLWRSLQVEDDDVSEYKKTLRWFLGSTILLLLGVLLSALSYSKVIAF